MCGIFGYVGKKDAVKTCLKGLKRLEYRGYDSAGIAGVKEGKIVFCKEEGKLSQLEKELDLEADLAIAHTRWATHGKPSKINAHPQFDENLTLAIVHNGIIENHEELRSQLDVVFESETDTEVVAHLIASLYEGDILKAVQKATALLKGSYAIALIHRDYPDQILAIAHESPLAIGIGSDEAFISSDPYAFADYTRDVIYLSNKEIALLKPGHIEVFDASHAPIEREPERLEHTEEEVSKGNYEHFTLKEIFEQPQAIKHAIASRLNEEYGTVHFEELKTDFKDVKRILILGCGTSWNAGYIASYMLEEIARIPTQVEISSEFRYKNPIVAPGTLVLALSQSGETADTLAAVRELRAKGAKVLAFCNVHGSSLVREADATIFLRAGPEIGVCSTKAFINQVVLLFLFTIWMARKGSLSKQQGQEYLAAVKELPAQVQQVLDSAEAIQKLAKSYAHYENFFFIGRHYMFPTSLEGALKLKEISYINANGYPAGEMKHGPIALINEACPTVALCANKATLSKLLSNLMEVKARGGKVVAIAEEKLEEDTIIVPSTIDELAPIPSSVAAQLFSYYIAKERGAEIDQPRNLAKSVTVE